MAAAKKKPAAKPETIKLSDWIEPQTRVVTLWSAERIRSAFLSAEGGSLYQLANLCEWIMADDRVKAVLHTRVQALLGIEPEFDASGDKRRSSLAVKALDVGEDWWSAYPESEASQMLRWGLVMGLAPARHYWTDPLEDHGGRRLPNPEFWHPQHLRYDWWSRKWMVRVAEPGSATGFTEVELVPGDGEWLLHTPYGKNRPWSLGLCHGLAHLVLWKHLAEEDWSRIGRKGAIVALTGDKDLKGDEQGNTKAAKQAVLESIYNRGREAIAWLPPGVDIKKLDTTGNAQTIYEAFINLINTAIAVLIRGGNLGTENQGGSRAATESQAETGDLVNLRFDAQSWETTVHDQSLVWWAQFNFGDAKLAPYPNYPVEPQEDLKGKTESDSKALDNCDVAEGLGFEVDRKLFLEQHRITWAKPGERPPEPVVQPITGPVDPNAPKQDAPVEKPLAAVPDLEPVDQAAE